MPIIEHTGMSFDDAGEIERPPIIAGNQYTFYSTVQEEYEPAEKRKRNYTGKLVTVLAHTNGDYEDEEGYEPIYRVRAADDFEFEAWEGELNGWFSDTGQFFWPDATWGHNHNTFALSNERNQ
jgi:hypothetical protein